MSKMAKVAGSIGVMDGVVAEEQDEGVDLCVETEGIRFYNVGPDTLKIEVTVHNRGYSASRPDTMLLEAAPLGAFVPWRPLQRLPVPVIAAGESLEVSTEVRLDEDDVELANGSREAEVGRFQALLEQSGEAVPSTAEDVARGNEGAARDGRAAPDWVLAFFRRGNFEGLSAWDIAALISRSGIRRGEALQQVLLSALEGGADPALLVLVREICGAQQSGEPGSASGDGSSVGSFRAISSSFSRAWRSLRSRRGQLLSGTDLSAMDPSRAAGRGNRHWAGNINVHLDGKAVERHQANGLLIYPGLENWALFNLGSRKGEEYICTFEGEGVAWDPMVFHLENADDEYVAARELRRGRECIGQGVGSGGSFVAPRASAWMGAVVTPPSGSGSGKLDIEIYELSSERSTKVEFLLDANASGAGLYTF